MNTENAVVKFIYNQITDKDITNLLSGHKIIIVFQGGDDLEAEWAVYFRKKSYNKHNTRFAKFSPINKNCNVEKSEKAIAIKASVNEIKAMLNKIVILVFSGCRRLAPFQESV